MHHLKQVIYPNYLGLATINLSNLSIRNIKTPIAGDIRDIFFFFSSLLHPSQLNSNWFSMPSCRILKTSVPFQSFFFHSTTWIVGFSSLLWRPHDRHFHLCCKLKAYKQKNIINFTNSNTFMMPEDFYDATGWLEFCHFQIIETSIRFS